MLKTILERVHEAETEKRERKQKSGYWLSCPSCGKSVVKKEFQKKGCFVCGFHGETGRATGGLTAPTRPYKSPCPRCGRPVVRDAMLRSGCYACGFTVETEAMPPAPRG